MAINAAKYVKKGTFEMGGNDAFVVLKDANMEKAVEAAVRSRVANAGQSCNSAKRFIVTEAVYDKFKDMLISKLKERVKIGDPCKADTNLGPLVSSGQLDKLHS